MPSYVQRILNVEVKNAVLYNKEVVLFREYKYQIIGCFRLFSLLFGFSYLIFLF